MTGKNLFIILKRLENQLKTYADEGHCCIPVNQLESKMNGI
jgi:hypothetical protein